VFDGLDITMTPTSPDQSDLVKISPSVLSLTRGEDTAYFNITCLLGTSAGYISFDLGGISSPTYRMQYDRLPFTVIGFDRDDPKVYKMEMEDVTRTSAVLKVHTSEPARVHWMISRRGTIPPPIYDMVIGRLPSTEAEVWYGYTFTNYHEATCRIPFTNLTDHTYYTVWVGVEDLAWKRSEKVEELTFRTTPTHRNARFSIVTTRKYEESELIT
jgi:hypothetical protein